MQQDKLLIQNLDMVLSEYLIFVIGIFATFFTLWSTVPQIRKSLRTKKTDDVSKWLIISLVIGLSLWVLYGVVKGDMIITGANSIGVSLNVFLLILKLKYSG
jgi:MtN3 and saliva related transmembrane protein